MIWVSAWFAASAGYVRGYFNDDVITIGRVIPRLPYGHSSRELDVASVGRTIILSFRREEFDVQTPVLPDDGGTLWRNAAGWSIWWNRGRHTVLVPASSGWEYGWTRFCVGGSSYFSTTTDSEFNVYIACPYWVVLGLLHIPTAFLFQSWRNRRSRPGHCPHCGYDLRATRDRCPECGLAASAPLT